MARRSVLAITLAAVAATAAAVPAGTSEATLTLVSGRLTVNGGEEACFRLSPASAATERLRVRVRFTSEVPSGWLTLDGTRSAAFREPSEEFVFVVDPAGVHRLTLELDDRAAIDWLSIASSGSSITQETCDSYDFGEERRANLRSEPPATIDRFERGRDRSRDGASAPPARAAEATPAPPPASASPDRNAPASAGGTIPAGSELELTLEREISTQSAYAGQGFQARLGQDLVIDGRLVLPAGTRVTGHVVESKDAGRFGKSNLTLGFDEALLADGRRVPIQGTLKRIGKGSAAKQGGIIAGSALGGAVLGKVLGGNSDTAVLGALIGAGIATGSIASKEGESITLPAGTVMSIGLDSTAVVPPVGNR